MSEIIETAKTAVLATAIAAALAGVLDFDNWPPDKDRERINAGAAQIELVRQRVAAISERDRTCGRDNWVEFNDGTWRCGRAIFYAEFGKAKK